MTEPIGQDISHWVDIAGKNILSQCVVAGLDCRVGFAPKNVYGSFLLLTATGTQFQ